MKDLIPFALHGLSWASLEEKRKLLEAYPREEDFRRLSRFEAEWFLGRKLRCRSFDTARILDRAKQAVERVHGAGIRYALYGDDSYPGLLKEIYDPPLLLFWKGSLPPQDGPSLAVVGTRKPSLGADRAAFCLGLDAVRGNIPLISGMAAGIDGAAHRGALALNGRTWAVLGTGCDRPYPLSHRRLAAEILAKGGGLISEFLPGTGPARYNFPRRNRIISGLSTQIVVVQAPRRSGALYTADFALDQGRDVCVHESGLGGRLGGGTAALASQGARVISLLKELYAHIPDPYRTMQDSFGLSRGSAEEAGYLTARLLREEMKGQAVFYKGRMQTHG